MTPDSSDIHERLNRSAQRVTAADPARMGHWLARHRQTDSLSATALAAKLGTDDTGLSRLAICTTPRPESFADDVRAIAAHCGANPAAVANLLRQEQAVAAWAGSTPTDVSSTDVGWLLAAHDADQPPPGDDDDDPRPN